MIAEAAKMAEVLSSITRAPFVVSEPPLSKPGLKGRAEWFVWCPDLAYEQETRYLKDAWKDADGAHWFESSDVISLARLVELECGEEKVDELAGLNLSSFGDPSVRADFALRFPQAEKQLGEWQEIMNQISKKRGVQLELRFDALTRFVAIVVGARVSPKSSNRVGLNQAEKTSGALREAYEAVSLEA